MKTVAAEVRASPLAASLGELESARHDVEADRRWMRRALALAARARGRTAPNPLVGAVIVKDGQRVAEGYHHRAGLDHGEVAALRKVGMRAEGAELYTNLEPCSHVGRTGPCTEAIIAAGIRRVIVGTLDPNPKVNGRGIQRLRDAGIEVTLGLLGAESQELNEAFAKHVVTGLPFVTLKAAVSLDGRIAAPGGDSRWISGEASRLFAHQLRNHSDAVLVGAGTVAADDPALTTRLPTRGGRDALRVVIDGRLRTRPSARLFAEESQPALIVGDETVVSRRAQLRLERAGAEVVLLRGKAGRVPIERLLGYLGKRGIVSLLVEGGSDLHGQLWQRRAVDRVLVIVAPLVIGSNGQPLAGFAGSARLADAVRLDGVSHRLIGSDILVNGTPAWAHTKSRARSG